MSARGCLGVVRVHIQAAQWVVGESDRGVESAVHIIAGEGTGAGDRVEEVVVADTGPIEATGNRNAHVLDWRRGIGRVRCSRWA